MFLVFYIGLLILLTWRSLFDLLIFFSCLHMCHLTTYIKLLNDIKQFLLKLLFLSNEEGNTMICGNKSWIKLETALLKIVLDIFDYIIYSTIFFLVSSHFLLNKSN